MKKLSLFLIRIYKKFISPCLPRSCRFYPSCSGYMYTSIERFGFIRGLFLGTKRLLKCQPFCKGGVDLVPETFTFKEYIKLKIWRN